MKRWLAFAAVVSAGVLTLFAAMPAMALDSIPWDPLEFRPRVQDFPSDGGGSSGFAFLVVLIVLIAVIVFAVSKRTPRGTVRPPGPGVPSAQSLGPAGWYPDPARRHELRYWDGDHWSPSVSDAGVRSTDPL